MKNPKDLTKKCLAYLSMIALVSCAAPKGTTTPMKKHSDSLTGGKVLVENKTEKKTDAKSKLDQFEIAASAKKTLTVESNGNVCMLDAEAGVVAYNGNMDEDSLLFLMPSDLVGMPVSLHCSASKTVVVSSHSIAIAKKGFGGSEKSAYSEIFGDTAFDVNTLYTPVDGETGKPASENIASVMSEDMLFVLSRDYSSAVCKLVVVDLQVLEHQVFRLAEAFHNGAVMVSHNGIVFAAGEAHKGEPYLIMVKMGSTPEGSFFSAEKEMTGAVSFEEQENGLLAVIGKDKIKIQMTISNKDVSNETTACFASSEKDASFECVVVDSVL